jgi:hypothetical protein
MPKTLSFTAVSETYPDTAANCYKKSFIQFSGIFYPSGKPISLQQLRCSPFAVVHYSFMGHFLAVAAILTRELSRLNRVNTAESARARKA